MNRSKQAAKGRRKIWQGHDEEDKKLCEEGTYELYSALTTANEEDKKEAARVMRKAFWLSDEAEEHQGKNPQKEKEKYKEAEECLRKSRELVDLETDSVKYTANWWKAYRHKDNKKVYENLIKENQVKLEDSSLAKGCADLLINAARKGHDKDDWGFT